MTRRWNWDRTVAVALLVYCLALGFRGIGRSLWLDEAWVANSVRSPDLAGMFYYADWLQTTPPLFLLFERWAVDVLGLSSATLRAVPLLLAGFAVLTMWSAARRVLSWPFALIAAALFASHPDLIEYSRTLKQYGGEAAASSCVILLAAKYFGGRSRDAFAGLTCAVLLAVPLAYSSVFLLPGLVLAMILAGDRTRAAILAVCAGLELAAIYFAMIRPNYSPALHAFWATFNDSLTPARWLGPAVCAASALWFWRRWLFWLTAVPYLLFAASAAAGWYPSSPRTRLFALPCLLLVGLALGERLSERLFGRRSWWPRGRAVLGGTIAACALLYGAWHEFDAVPVEEDYAAAVATLRSQAGASDLIVVHAAAREGFQLYSAMEQWTPSRVAYGETGWPCCVRGHEAAPGGSSREAALRDIDSKIPEGFRGRVWLLYPTRPSHWAYAGVNEGDLWRSRVWERGCPPANYRALANLALSPMDCR